MMESGFKFDELPNVNAALWCGADLDAGELAQMVQVAVEKKTTVMSVAPTAVGVVWPWLEGVAIKIFARFYFSEKKISEQQVSDATVRINTAFKHGAHGAQVFLSSVAALSDLVRQTHIIRDDLFFAKDLSIGLDICGIGVSDWNNLFADLRKINASSLVLVMARDMGAKSDFAAQVFGMLDAWTDENKFDLHFVLGPNPLRIEQAMRLIHKMRPELATGMRFFVY